MSRTLQPGTGHIGACRRRAGWWSPRDASMRSLSGWIERPRQRRALQDLDDHLLKDIGISRAAAMSEAAKSFWM
jgi:uncharacterized protein YjiS (DUF1127 family)